ncbi:hypothetical protein [Kribbella alba]|uniref:hypothetical protein n=1 Tax=Kribbella alba TaxID=190197 RepID=UPI0031DC35F1
MERPSPVEGLSPVERPSPVEGLSPVERPSPVEGLSRAGLTGGVRRAVVGRE